MGRRQSRFGQRTLEKAYFELVNQLRLLGARAVVVSTNVPLRNDGRPYSNPGRMDDPGVAVFFRLAGRDYCMPCDCWRTVEENVYAIAKHVAAMSGQLRWGVASVEQAFAGFKALPASDPFGRLGLHEGASVAAIEAAFRERAVTCHPDKGGSHEVMAELNRAREEALQRARSGEVRP